MNAITRSPADDPSATEIGAEPFGDALPRPIRAETPAREPAQPCVRDLEQDDDADDDDGGFDIIFEREEDDDGLRH